MSDPPPDPPHAIFMPTTADLSDPSDPSGTLTEPVPSAPQYVPAAYLVARPPLTAPQLVSQFQDFRDSLRFISTAPELVFEHLVANLSEVFTAAFEVERQQHTQSLQLNDQLKKKLAELKDTVFVRGDQRIERDPRGNASPASSNPRTVGNTPGTIIIFKDKVKASPIIGSFNIGTLVPEKSPVAKAERLISFASPYSVPPSILTGLTGLDFSFKTNIRVKSYTSNIIKDGFEVHIDSWGDTIMHGARCAWMGIEADDPDFQFGNYNTLEDPKKHRPLAHNERKVTFQRPYPIPPQVVVWLSGFEMGHETGWRVKSYATNVTTTGFTIHIDTWSDTSLLSVIASWVAYPSNKPGIFSGCFSTLDLRSIHYPQLLNSGYEKFRDDTFTCPPRVLLAINSFDFSCKKNMRLSVKASSISAGGMTWHLDAWMGTIMCSVGASYIAIS